jgi:hypothetical protein
VMRVIALWAIGGDTLRPIGLVIHCYTQSVLALLLETINIRLTVRTDQPTVVPQNVLFACFFVCCFSFVIFAFFASISETFIAVVASSIVCPSDRSLMWNRYSRET